MLCGSSNSEHDCDQHDSTDKHVDASDSWWQDADDVHGPKLEAAADEGPSVAENKGDGEWEGMNE